MPDDKAWKVKIDPKETGSTLDVFGIVGIDGNKDVNPQRQVLHELIVQTVSERKVLPDETAKYEGHLSSLIKEARQTPLFRALEDAGTPDPQKISLLLDDMGLERLPVHARAEQVMMVTGGPGTGKTSIVEEMAKNKPEVYRDAAQINPDHYKDFLASRPKLGEIHGTYTHPESSMIADKIIGRLNGIMDAKMPAPHVLMDVASAWPNYVKFAKEFDQMTVMTGTAPPEVTAQRAYKRGYDEAGKVVDRVTPINVVLGGAAKSSQLMPNVFDHPNLEFTMVSTDVPDGEMYKPVASWDNDTRRLSVHDPDSFLDFVERQNINTAAENAGQLFEGVERSAENLAEDLKPYTDKGVRIDLLKPSGEVAVSLSQNGAEVLETLESKRGAGFIADMAEHFGKIGKHSGVVAKVAFGTLSGAFTLAAGGSKAQAAEALYKTAVVFGETQVDLVNGHMTEAARSATIETASTLGSLGGAAAGAAAGAAIGSIIPGVGTVVGGVVGGVAGSIGGGIAVGEATEYITDHIGGIRNSAITVSQGTVATLSAATHEVSGLIGSAWGFIVESEKPSLDARTAFEKLPNAVKPDMPPEVASLVEVKRSQALFEKQFRELEKHGGLDDVAAYIEKHPLPAAEAPGLSSRSYARSVRAATLDF